MFILNQKVVYPGLGVAKINRLIEKQVGISTITLYELKFINKEMTILVPTSNSVSIGLRSLTSREHIGVLYDFLAQPARRFKAHELTSSNWNRRSKEYQIKLMSGNIQDISHVYRELKNLAKYKELSFGEKHMLTQTESLLAEEISMVKELAQEKTIESLRALFEDHFPTQSARAQVKQLG